jgi:hypothetical protein
MMYSWGSLAHQFLRTLADYRLSKSDPKRYYLEVLVLQVAISNHRQSQEPRKIPDTLGTRPSLQSTV